MPNLILGVTGGISAYKAADLILGLKANGFDVRVIMTKHAKEFITPMTLATLSGHPVMDDMWKERDGKVEHIDVAKWAEVFAVYPASANIIGKFANGIADDLLSTVYLALPLIGLKPVTRIIFPAMNTNMYIQPAVVENIAKLAKVGCIVTETRISKLACGDIDQGCLLKPRDAVKIIMDRCWRLIAKQEIDRSHEECCDCALAKTEPPICKGHVSGEMACSEFKQASTYSLMKRKLENK